MGEFFLPAIKLMNQLSYPKKLALISTLFLTILVSPMYELTKSVLDDVNFSKAEESGVKYLNPTMESIVSLVKFRRMAWNFQHGTAPLSAVQDVLSELHNSFNRLKRAHNSNKQLLDDPRQLSDAEHKIKALNPNSPDLAVAEAISAIQALYGSVQFNSNLILDPDADSYSMMDTVVLQLPYLLPTLEESRQLSHELLQKGNATSQDYIKLSNLRTQLQYRFDMIKGDVATAYPHTQYSQLKPSLDPTFQQFSAKLSNYLATLDKEILDHASAQFTLSTSEMDQKALNVIETGDQVFTIECSILDHLISARIDSKWPKLYRTYLIAIFFLCSIGYLMMGLYHSVINAITRLQKTSQNLANGDLSTRVYLDTSDELGSLAGFFNTIAEAFEKVIQHLKEDTGSLATASRSLTNSSKVMSSAAEQTMNLSSSAAHVTEDLDARIQTVAASAEESSANIKEVYAASSEVESNNKQVVEAVADISSRMQSIADDTEDMSASVNTIASAIEEMSASLNEVSQNASQAANVANRAEHTAQQTRKTFNELGTAAHEIGNVVDVIKSIANQTNLLALNATIEASSAGEAGKGFAVVANEVKELAKQSAAATEEIRQRISQIQNTTNNAVFSINEISTVINELNAINQTIASTVEEQTVTVNEISRNFSVSAQAASNISNSVHEAANKTNQISSQIVASNQGLQKITRNLEELTLGANEISKNALAATNNAVEMASSVENVKRASTETSENVSDVEHTAKELANLADDLERMVAGFKSSELNQKA
jgi:methyl-accepting chemotaxis protein